METTRRHFRAADPRVKVLSAHEILIPSTLFSLVFSSKRKYEKYDASWVSRTAVRLDSTALRSRGIIDLNIAGYPGNIE